MTILCDGCRLVSRHREQRAWSIGAVSEAEWERIGRLICSCYGPVRPSPDATDAMLSKLLQLDRFGLSAGGGPLLERATGGGGGSSPDS